MADSSATAAAGAVKTNQVKQNLSYKVKQHNTNKLKTTYGFGKEENGHAFFRSYEEALKALEEYEVKTATKFVCRKRPKDFENNGKLIDVRMGSHRGSSIK